MGEENFVRLRDWVEPAHPAVIRLYDDLISIYKRLRGTYQAEIDKTFDRVSQQIGFVVTVTIPVVFEAGEKGVIKSISIGAEHLKGTLFDKEFSAVLKPQPDAWVSAPGTYRLYLLWVEALKLKLRTDWMEPAHLTTGRLLGNIKAGSVAQFAGKIPIPWVEPAHWFDSGSLIAAEEAVVIEAIDEVYPELKIVDRIAAIRAANRAHVRPEVMEPAHFRQMEGGALSEKALNMLSEITAVLRKYGN